VYFITLHFLVRKILTFYINDVLLFKCPIPRPTVNASHAHAVCFTLYNGCYKLGVRTLLVDVETCDLIRDSNLLCGLVVPYDTYENRSENNFTWRITA
jgi:hypothetical protein